MNFGSLGRTSPISDNFGFDRGTPIDRYYIQLFLSHHAGDVRGRVLEIGDNSYTLRFGGSRVSGSDVLHVAPGNPAATIIGSLEHLPHVSDETFDCIILTQTLHLIYNLDLAVATLFRILKPGGVVLATVPGVSSIDRGEWGESWYWSLTPAAARRLFEGRFKQLDLAATTYGNVFSAISFLHGLAVEEVPRELLEHCDPQIPTIVAIRAKKLLEGL